MKTPPLSDDEAARARQAFEMADESWAFWEKNADDLARTYSGEWIAMRGAEVVAHSKEPDVLEGELARRPDFDQLLIRWVPPPTAEFAF